MATLSYITSIHSTSDSATYAFDAVPLGAESAGRRIFLAIMSRRGGTAAIPVLGVTVGGDAANIAYQQQHITNHGSVVGIAEVLMPSGTTGSMSITFQQIMARCIVSVWSADGVSGVPYDTRSSKTTFPSTIINVPKNGIVLACKTAGGSNLAGVSWSGLIKDYDSQVEASRCSSASGLFADPQTDYPISISKQGTGGDWTVQPLALFASFGPEDSPLPPPSRRYDPFRSHAFHAHRIGSVV